MILARPALTACLMFALTPVASAQQQASPAAPAAPVKPVAPGTAPQGTGDYLSRMDTDGDRRISLLEYQEWLTYAFDGMDRNRDGVLAGEQPGGRARLSPAPHARLATVRRRTSRSGFLDAKELAARRRDADPAYLPAAMAVLWSGPRPHYRLRRADFSPLNRSGRTSGLKAALRSDHRISNHGLTSRRRMVLYPRHQPLRRRPASASTRSTSRRR